jgi:hypothetical protein
MPRATELCAALFIAKLIAIIGAIPRQERPAFILINGAHRIFRALPKTLHGNRLFTALLTSPLTSVLASNQGQALSPLIVQACPTRILSADAWNQIERERRHSRTPYVPSSRGDKPAPPIPPPVLPNSFVLEDGYYGVAQPFVARTFEAKGVVSTEEQRPETAGPPAQADEAQPPADVANIADPVLIKRILQEVKAYDSPSMPSLISYLSAEFPKEAVQKAIDGLEKSGFAKLSPKQQKSGRTILSLGLTEKGIELLGRLA